MTPQKTTPQKKRKGKRNTAAEPPIKKQRKKKEVAEEVTPGAPPTKKARRGSSSPGSKIGTEPDVVAAAIATGLLGEALTKEDVEEQGTKVADLKNPDGALFFISHMPADAANCLYLTFAKPQMKLNSRAMC